MSDPKKKQPSKKAQSKSLQSKKDKVTKKSAKVSSTTMLIGALLVVMVGVGVYFTLGQGEGDEAVRIDPVKQSERISVSDPVDYTQERVDMTTINYKTDDENVTFALDDVKKNKLATFSYESPTINVETQNFAGEPKLPVLALIDPKGNLMVGVSYCEPCRSTTFHTETDLSLTCNKCGTKWDLETLTPRSGACGAFPPDEIDAEVDDGVVKIPKAYLENWKPRKET